MSIIYNETEIESIKYGDTNVDSVFFSNTEVFTKTFNWPSSGNIPEATFLAGIDAGSYDTSLVGRYVTLTEYDINYDSKTHNWLIIRVNEDSYDLWYNGSIGQGTWGGAITKRYWTNQSLVYGTNNPRYLCDQYKIHKLSYSIRDTKLKTGLNANCGDDTVVILSARQLGYTGVILAASDDTSNTAIPYFNSNDRRKAGNVYWTSSATSSSTTGMYCVGVDGTFYSNGYGKRYHVIPAIRVG